MVATASAFCYDSALRFGADVRCHDAGLRRGEPRNPTGSHGLGQVVVFCFYRDRCSADRSIRYKHGARF